MENIEGKVKEEIKKGVAEALEELGTEMRGDQNKEKRREANNIGQILQRLQRGAENLEQIDEEDEETESIDEDIEVNTGKEIDFEVGTLKPPKAPKIEDVEGETKEKTQKNEEIGSELPVEEGEPEEVAEEEEETENKKEKKQDTSNPFLALFGVYDKKSSEKKEKNKDKEKTKQEKEKALTKESWIEKEYLRPLTKEQVSGLIFNLHDIYKKSHGMASFT